MIKPMLILLALFCELSYGANTAVIFSDGYGKFLPSLGAKFADNKVIATGSDDPTSVAKAGEAGSMYLRSNGAVYVKQDAGTTTNWDLLSVAGSIASPITLAEEAGTPTTPAGGSWSFYFKSGGPFVLDDLGNEYNILAGGGIPVMPKGAVLTSDGIENGYLAAGQNNQVLKYDSSTASGLKGSYCTVGEVKSFHDFSGTLPVPRGFMKLDGSTVNQAAYNALHGAGKYTDDDIANSPILNQVLPTCTSDCYLTGSTAAGASVGSNTKNLAHTHEITDHAHIWYNAATDANDASYDSGGSSVSFDNTSYNTAYDPNEGGGILVADGETDHSPFEMIDGDFYTDDSVVGTVNSGAASPSLSSFNIQPSSVRVIHIICVR